MTMSDALLPEWSLGDRLRKARQSAGISRPQMRERLLAEGVSAAISTLSAWETDAARPGHGKDMLKVIAAWSAITTVPATWILGLAGDASPRYAQMDSDLPVRSAA